MLTFIIVCVIISIIMQMVIECIIFLLLFMLLRSYVGGIHMHTYKSCFLVSCLVTCGVLVLSKYFSLNPITAFFVSIVILVGIFFMDPVEHENRPVTAREKKYFEKQKRKILFCIFICLIFAFVFRQKVYLSTMLYTLLAITMSMVIGKIKNVFEQSI